MKKWILGLVLCVALSGCMGCDKDDVAKAIANAQAKGQEAKQAASDPNSGLNKAVDTIGNGADKGKTLLESPLGAFIPEPWRSGALLLTSLAAGAAAWWQKSRKTLAVKTLGATVNAIENSGAGGSIKPTVKSNLIDQGIYVDGKTLIMSVKQ